MTIRCVNHEARIGALLALMVAVLVVWLSGCNRTEPEVTLRLAVLNNCEYDVNGFIVDKLQLNRVVMLADFGHGYSLPQRSVTTFLEYWLQQIGRTDSSSVTLPSKLFLVLEADSETIARFQSYTISGDARELMRRGDVRFAVSSPTFTVEDLEFYSDLGEIQKRVGQHNALVKETASLNKHIGAKFTGLHEIGFEVVGAEKSINIANWSISRRDSFFIWERDEYSSQYIVDLLEQHPDYRALVFYGAAHLQKGKVHKSTYESATRRGIEGDGYFLAHYLSEHFAKNGGAYTIGQAWAADLNPHCYLAPEKTYAVDNAFLERIDIESIPGKRLMAGVDGGVVYFEDRDTPTPVIGVWSENIVDEMIATLQETTNLENDFVRAIHNSIYRYLETYAGVVLSAEERVGIDSTTSQGRIERYLNWRKKTQVDVVADIDTGGPSVRNIKRLEQSETSGQLQCIGCIKSAMGRYAPRLDSDLPENDLAKPYTLYLESNESAIAIENLVNLLWVGSSVERTKAMAVLNARTQQKFKKAKEWSVWWRANRPKVVHPDS